MESHLLNAWKGIVCMFDPTIFENLKVVAEGAVYDLDLSSQIVVTNRMDQVDLAKLSRHYAITFRKSDKRIDSVHGELRIDVDAHDLSAEILEKEDDELGCSVEVLFYTSIKHIEQDCLEIQTALHTVWGNRPRITQELSFFYNDDNANNLVNKIRLKFDRKITEAQVEDLPVMVDYMVESIDLLNTLK